MKFLTIFFNLIKLHRFLFNSQSELIEWVIAFYNSIYSETPAIQNAKSNIDLNKLIYTILSANQINITRADSSIYPNSMNNMDDLSLGLLMANTAAFNMNLGAVGSMAAIGSAGLLAASAQHQLATGDIQSLFNNQRFNANSLPSEFLNSNRNRYYGDAGTCLNDDSTAFFIDGDTDAYALQVGDAGDGNAMMNDDALPIAEIGLLAFVV